MPRRGPRGYVAPRRGTTPTQRRIAAAAERRRPVIEAQTRYAKESGYKSRRDYLRAVRAADQKFGLAPQVGRQMRSQRYWNIVREFRDENHPGMRLTEVRAREDFRQVLVDLYSTDTSHDGPLARALVRIGRRDPNATYRVGETPK